MTIDIALLKALARRYSPCSYLESGNLYHVSNTKCALFIKGDFISEFAVFPDIPYKIFTVHINGKKIPT